MCALISSAFLLITSIGLMAFALISNQLEPTYANALTLPIVNAASATLAFLAALLAVIAANNNSHSSIAKIVAITSVLLTLTLLLLIPMTNLGLMSIVQ